MATILIYGAGGLGRIALDIFHAQARHRTVAFLDRDLSLCGEAIDDVPVRGNLSAARTLMAEGVSGAYVAIGCNETRCLIASQLRMLGFDLVSPIHPTAVIAARAEVREHVMIGARAAICVHATVAAHAIIATNAIVEHDNVIGAGAFVEPAARLAGGVRLGERARVGIGACVIPGRSIGAQATVGPGAIVIRDVPDGVTVRGAPARLPELASVE